MSASPSAPEGIATPPLLQSYAWGEVQARSGWDVERVRLGAGGASVQVQSTLGMRWAYVPRGPVPATAEAVGQLCDWARERGLVRLRLEPDAGPELAAALRSLGLRPAAPAQPVHTMIVALTGAEGRLSDDALLAQMKRGTRYNVRLADRKGVEVARGADPEEMGRLSQASATHQSIILPGPSRFALMESCLPGAATFIARFEGRAIAGLFTAAFAGRGHDLYSGYTREHPELKAAYALKWAAIAAAAAAGCHEYDLWGVPPSADASHPWHGLWELKSGFGGRLVEYCGAWDLVLDERAHRLLDVAGSARRTLSRQLGRLRPPR